MDERDGVLSEQSTTILGLIAEGRSYEQILQRHPTLTYFDVFAAAREALDRLQAPAPEPTEEHRMLHHLANAAEVGDGEAPPEKRLPLHIERARKTHRRAWARWTRDEDAQLTTLFQQGAARSEIEQQLGRQPGAITGRLLKLGLISEDGDAMPQPAPDVQPAVPRAVEPRDRVVPATPLSVSCRAGRRCATDSVRTRSRSSGPLPGPGRWVLLS